LIEVIVVIAVILTIAAIAIPRLLRSRMLANEAGAVSGLRTIATVQVTYQSNYQQGYAPTLDALGPPASGPPSATAADLIDPVLASGIKSGYSFVYVAIDADGDGKPEAFRVNANPVSVGQTGEKYFYVDQANVVRWALGGPANASSQPIPP